MSDHLDAILISENALRTPADAGGDLLETVKSVKARLQLANLETAVQRRFPQSVIR